MTGKIETAEIKISTHSVFRCMKMFSENLERAYGSYGYFSMQLHSQYLTVAMKDFDGRLVLYAAFYPDVLGSDFAPLWKAAEAARFKDREISHFEFCELYRWIDETYLGNEWITLRFESAREDIEVEIAGVTRRFGYSEVCSPQNDGAGIQEA